MPDYIYLLENRLSADQQNALRLMREATREAGMILFLTGDAVRDLTSGHTVRDLEVSVHGNALKLKKTIEKLGGSVWGEDEASRTLYLCFPGTVRLDVISAHRAEYPKPGKPVFHKAPIQEDLHRRDFTVNAMAISLNEGSFGLLMDPLNGAADIETRTLRLVSNYGFIEEPSLLIRATRYRTRLGWELDSRSKTRYENAKGDGVIEFLSPEARCQELEQIGHEEEGLKVLRALEAEGWMQFLFPAWTSAKADEEKLKALQDLAVDLLLEGVHADISAAQMQLLTAKLASKDLAALKKLMLRPGFVAEWNKLDALAAGFAKALLAKENSVPSAGYKLFTSYDPEAILWLGFTSKDAAVRERFNLFLKVWPEARQRIPHALMQEMRITPELANYQEIVHMIFLELIDGRLNTPEEIHDFLEPYEPPPLPTPVTIKKTRTKRGAEARIKENSYDDEDESEEDSSEDDDLDDLGGDDDEAELGLSIPKRDLDSLGADDAESAEDESDEIAEEKEISAPSKHSTKKPVKAGHAKSVPEPAPVKVQKPVAVLVSKKAEKAEKPQVAPKSKLEPKTVKHVSVVVVKAVATAAKPVASSAKAKSAPAPALPKSKPVPQAKTSSLAVKGSKVPMPVFKAKPEPASKAPAKVMAKIPAKVHVPAAKPALAKGKPSSAASSKAGKTLPKQSHPAEKKSAPKSAKKH
jgi:tRNA nucleotidyltransferase/poly(A) polymerase